MSTLLVEGCDYLHSVLSCSALRRRLFVLPFRRDFDLDIGKVLLLHNLIHRCKKEGGFIVVAPEHRLSLEMKVKELHLCGQLELSKDLHEVVSDSWYDVIDEVDEVLHHRFQIVYSMGTAKPLPQGRHRWRSIQALLKMMEKCQMDGVRITPDKDAPEAFPLVSIDDDIDIPNFRLKMAKLLVEDPPLDFKWIKGHHMTNRISHIITDPDSSPNDISLSEEHFYDLLSFRGLLAFDILLQCLRSRHRVNYGVNKDRKKRLSVPFRGADMPSQRAEFSHQDCAITLTNLAYYDQGLSRDSISKTFEKLLCLGKNSRADIYYEWLNMMSNVNKIDLTNYAKVDILFEYFRKTPCTIDFWLNNYVYPCELDHYPERLVNNSWHIAHSVDNHCVGFSGTNDTHRILPLQIRQYLPWDTTDSVWRSFLSTNGKMIDIVMNKTISCEELEEGPTHQTLLSFIKLVVFGRNKKVDALIDSGALLVGRSNFDVAEFTMGHCILISAARLRGVTFFNEAEGEWMVLEASGKCATKDQSQIREDETFAIFDEPRCRGVDLKLRPDAVAVLTLGHHICKDKFMQAAGRMRQLSRGQNLVVVGEPKVFKEIRKLNRSLFAREGNDDILQSLEGLSISTGVVDIKYVLSWIMCNTIELIRRGVRAWIEQGMFYATGTKPEHFVLEEKMGLADLYGSPIHKTSVSDLIVSARDFHSTRTGGGNKSIMDKISSQFKGFDDTSRFVWEGTDEECERESERENEQEKEEENEYERMSAYCEVEWNYS
eukprot:15366067-Ditylum_brightwellii.AAC.1